MWPSSGSLGCSLLRARRLLQKFSGQSLRLIGKRVAHFHGQAAVEMSRKLKDGTRSLLHVHWPDVLELPADAL